MKNAGMRAGILTYAPCEWRQRIWLLDALGHGANPGQLAGADAAIVGNSLHHFQALAQQVQHGFQRQ